MRKQKITVTLTIETDKDLNQLSDEQIAVLHEEFWACGSNLYDMSSSKMEFNGIEVATMGEDEPMVEWIQDRRVITEDILMRTHKFMCLMLDTHYLEQIIPTVELCEQIVHSEDDYMAVLTCHHENMEDNIVTLRLEDGEDYDFIKTTDGQLYYFYQWMTKLDVVNAFE